MLVNKMFCNFIISHQIMFNLELLKEVKKNWDMIISLKANCLNKNADLFLVESIQWKRLYCIVLHVKHHAYVYFFFKIYLIIFQVECCLQGLHKGHDLKNVHKNYDSLTPSIEDLRFKIKTRTDHLINDESRLT